MDGRCPVLSKQVLALILFFCAGVQWGIPTSCVFLPLPLHRPHMGQPLTVVERDHWFTWPSSQATSKWWNGWWSITLPSWINWWVNLGDTNHFLIKIQIQTYWIRAGRHGSMIKSAWTDNHKGTHTRLSCGSQDSSLLYACQWGRADVVSMILKKDKSNPLLYLRVSVLKGMFRDLYSHSNANATQDDDDVGYSWLPQRWMR